jgi:hypothetical protein
MARTIKRFTIYDAMEAAGHFDSNPANTYATDSVTKQSIYRKAEYPKMLFHPKGEERVSVPAEEIMTPFGPKKIGEQRELIHQVVNSPSEEQRLLADGWHPHPADAIGARTGIAPERSSDETISKLMAELEAKKAELAAMTAVAKQSQAAQSAKPAK